MSSFPIIINHKIPNDPDKIYEQTNDVLENILDHVALDLGYQRRIKLIVIELITNSIKHSIEGYTTMKMIIDHPHLSIQKIERGLKIKFSSNSPQLPFEDINKKISIGFTDANRLTIQPLSQYRFKFLKPEQEETSDIMQIPEHFGLYIITLAADSFVYQYDPELKENSFVIHLNL